MKTSYAEMWHSRAFYTKKFPKFSLGEFYCISFKTVYYFTSSKITGAENQLVMVLWYKYGIELRVLFMKIYIEHCPF